MKKITFSAITFVLSVALYSSVLAEGERESPRVSLCNAAGFCVPPLKDNFVLLVLEDGVLHYEKKPIPNAEVTSYVNGLLKYKKALYVGVYVREGTKFGDVVRAVDLLKGTDAQHIGVSINEIPNNREP
jgi:biopolymer transport protein ExbD